MSKNRLKCDRSKIISKDFLDLKHKMLLLSLTNLLLYTKRIFFLNFNFVTWTVRSEARARWWQWQTREATCTGRAWPAEGQSRSCWTSRPERCAPRGRCWRGWPSNARTSAAAASASSAGSARGRKTSPACHNIRERENNPLTVFYGTGFSCIKVPQIVVTDL